MECAAFLIWMARIGRTVCAPDFDINDAGLRRETPRIPSVRRSAA